MRFKVGDRVRAVFDHHEEEEFTGTIQHIHSSVTYVFESDTPFSFAHSCGGRVPNDRGRWAYSHELSLLEPPKKRVTGFAEFMKRTQE